MLSIRSWLKVYDLLRKYTIFRSKEYDPRILYTWPLDKMTLPVQAVDNIFWALWLWHWNRHRFYFAHFQTFRISFMSHFRCMWSMRSICQIGIYVVFIDNLHIKTSYDHVNQIRVRYVSRYVNQGSTHQNRLVLEPSGSVRCAAVDPCMLLSNI